jgi:nitrogen fixation/metabolism regulation signal transduction histidine kinase
VLRFFRAGTEGGAGRAVGWVLPEDRAAILTTARDDFTRVRTFDVWWKAWRLGFVVLAPVVFLLTAAAAFWVARLTARRIARPVGELAAAADAIAAGDLSRRAPSGGEDEIGDLVVAFNRMGEQLEASREELLRVERIAAWRDVARRIAHEIKNPLTPIQLAAERLRRKYLASMPSEQAQVLDRATNTIVQQVEALKAMVNEFSDYARPSKMDPRPVEVDDFVADVIALYEGAEHKVHFTPGAPHAKIEGDPLRLRQVLHNLVKNALESGGEEEARVWVRTRPVERRGKRWVALEVEDDGAGFDSVLRDQIFEPYVTSKQKGTGLGLAIVKRIVGEHGGNIRAENRVEGGARIVVSLPLRTAEVHTRRRRNKVDGDRA